MENGGLKGDTMEAGYQRHISVCNNAVLPGDRLPFRIGAEQVGWVKPAFAAQLAAQPQYSDVQPASVQR